MNESINTIEIEESNSVDFVKRVSIISVTLAFFIVAGSMVYVKIWDTDVWWHLKAGEVITDSQEITGSDVFSFTKSGEKWINDEWMGDVYLYNAYKKWGVSGVQGFAVGITLLICLILYYTAVSGGADPLLAAPFVLGAVWASRIRLSNGRPEMFSLLFTSAVFFLLSRALRRRKGDTEIDRSVSYALILIPVIHTFWVNIHPSAPLGLLLIGISIMAGLVSFMVNLKTGTELAPETDSLTMRRMGTVLIASVFATLLNPYGIHGLIAPLKFAQESPFLRHITEWAPIPISHFFRAQGEPGRFGLPLFIILGIAGFIKNRRHADLFQIIVFILTAYMAVRSRRFIATFCLLAAPMAAIHLTPLIGGLIETRVRYAVAAGAFVLMFFALFKFDVIGNERFIWGAGIHSGNYPDAAISFITSQPFKDNMYNEYDLGGALIWGLHPKRKVFIDGRSTFYGGDFYLNDLEFSGRPTVKYWNELQERWNLNYAVLRVNSKNVIDTIRKSKGDWRTVFWDDDILILVKNIPEHERLITEHEYTVTDPYTAIDIAQNWKRLPAEIRDKVKSEHERNLRTSPRNMIAIRALVFIYYRNGEYDRAMSLAEKGLEIDGRVAGLHAVRGELLLRRNRREEALSEFKSAAELMPEYRKIVEYLEAEGVR